MLESEDEIERRLHHNLRDMFHETRLLSRIIPDIEHTLDIHTDDAEVEFDLDDFAIGGLWDGGDRSAPGGLNYADESAENADTEDLGS